MLVTRRLSIAYSLLLCAACSAAGNGGSGGAGEGASSQGGSGGGTTTAVTTGTGAQGGGFNVGGGTGQGGGITCTPGGPDDDVDQDGFTPNQGDCEDCDPNRNPNAIEVPTEMGQTPFDEDCDDEIDEPEDPPCDTGIAIDDMDPLLSATAIDLCKVSSGPDDWGVVSAKWVLADGTDPVGLTPSQLQGFHLGHGFLPAFGANVDVRRGERMLVVSSGAARQPSDPGYQSTGNFDKGYTSGHPQGFPKESPACPGSITGQPHDSTGVEITVRTPSNATGFSFDFDFFTYEWPGFVCSTYNDFFVAILDPIPMNQTDGNISFDSAGNPVSVNNALLEVCGCPGNPPNPCMAGGKIFNCSLGNIELIQTGFGFDTEFGQDHGSTSWLRTQAPVEGGTEMKLRLATYDSGDGVLNSTTLVDNFKWIAKPGVMVGTNPVPE
ncbi:MAG: choice-of-anchor L domain-containing protein [Myxococcales bacterium]|nr:choice-of-anchor L domain-containing protein [Myxococcales bacterium]